MSDGLPILASVDVKIVGQLFACRLCASDGFGFLPTAKIFVRQTKTEGLKRPQRTARR